MYTCKFDNNFSIDKMLNGIYLISHFVIPEVCHIGFLVVQVEQCTGMSMSCVAQGTVYCGGISPTTGDLLFVVQSSCTHAGWSGFREFEISVDNGEWSMGETFAVDSMVVKDILQPLPLDSSDSVQLLGTGLGLAICVSVSIKIISLGQYTRIYFWLRRVTCSEPSTCRRYWSYCQTLITNLVWG